MAQIIEKAILDTLVHLVRECPWGPTREALEGKAAALRDGTIRGTEDISEWQATVHEFAAAVRFPRDGDDQVERMSAFVKDEIRASVEGDPFRTHDARSEGVRVALQKALAGMTPDNLRTLQIAVVSEIVDERAKKQAEAARIYDLIDTGADRPSDITEERWNAAVRSYHHQMTLENTPDDFLYPDRDEGRRFDWSADEEQAPARRDRVRIEREATTGTGGYRM